MYLKSFPEKLKNLRLSNNLTQSELAVILETTKQTISAYESGKINPSLFTLIKLSEHFGVSIDSLIFNSNNSNTFININDKDDLYTQISLEIKHLRILQKNLSNLCLYFLKAANKLPNEIDEINNEISKLENLFLNECNSKKIDGNDEEYAKELTPNIVDIDSYKDEKDSSISYRNILCYGGVPAGTPYSVFGEVIDNFDVPECNLSHDKNYYIVSINGESMNELFADQDLILVECTHTASNSDIVIAFVNNEDNTVKKIEFHEDYISLIPMSDNPIYKVQTYDPKKIHIQGKVLGKLSDFLDVKK